jgi:hypothetical protein
MGLVSKQPDDEESLEHVTITGFGPLDDDRPGEVRIDLGSWADDARGALDERMHLLQAPHGWDGSTLVIEDRNEAWIQRIIEQVGDDRAIELTGDEEQIAYDLSGWDDANRAALKTRLQDDMIPYGIEGDELVVNEIDEVRVDEAIDAVLEPDSAPVADGEARTEVMGELFVAADRLIHDPSDPDGRKAIDAGAEEAATHAPPYGMDRAWWRGLGDQLRAFSSLLAVSASLDTDQAVVDAATALRDELRQYV